MSPRSSLRTFLAAILTAVVAWAPAARADISDPFLVENVNRESGGDGTYRILELGDDLIAFSFLGFAPYRIDPAGGVTRPELPGFRGFGVLGTIPDRPLLLYRSSDPVAETSTLYATDGTVAGTRRLTPPDGNYLPYPTLAGKPYFSDAGLFYFGVRRDSGDELWSTDGTVAGTRKLMDSNGPTAPLLGGDLAGITLFGGYDGEGELQLFRTDGTAAGTRVVHPVAPITLGGETFYRFGDRLFFNGYEEDTGYEPWVTDGTPEGTRLLRELTPGPDSQRLLRASTSGDLVYFSVSSRATKDLWVTDGTAAGTRRLAEFPDPRGLGFLTPFGERSVAFEADTEETGTEVWVSNGTQAGTLLLGDLCPDDEIAACRQFSTGLPVRGYREDGGGLYFTTLDGRLFHSDGTPAGTEELEICPSCKPVDILAQDGSLLYLVAVDENLEQELYVSEAGNPAVRLTDFPNGRPFLPLLVPDFRPALVTDDGTLFFVAYEGGVGTRLYRVGDGRVTPPVTPVATLSGPTDQGSHPSGFAAFEGDLVFVADDGLTGPSLYRKTGTQPARRLGLLAPVAAQPYRIEIVAGRILVHSYFGTLWSSDGSPGSVRRLEGVPQANPSWRVGDRLVFPYDFDPPAGDIDLWFTDGTEAGSGILAHDIDAATRTENGVAYVREGVLWETDGTIAGTTRLYDFGTAFRAVEMAAVGPHVFVAGGDRISVFDAQAGRAETYATSGSFLRFLGPAGGRRMLYITQGATFSSEEHELWSVSGDGAEPVQLGNGPLRDLPGHPDREPQVLEHEVARLGDELWFLADDQVFRSDGTPDGTRPVVFVPAVGVDRLFAIPGHVLFGRVVPGSPPAAERQELWVTDGTAAGTRRLRGFREIGIEAITVGDHVYFAADADSEMRVGNEAWAVTVDPDATAPPPPQAPPADGPPETPGDLRIRGYQVLAADRPLEIRWNDVEGETRYVLQARGWREDGDFETVAVLLPDTRRVLLTTSGEPRIYRIRAENDQGVSAWSDEVAGASITTVDDCNGAMSRTPEALCLRHGRFSVRVLWRSDRNGTAGEGKAVPFDFSDESGSFWFFNRENVELVVKILDGRPVNGQYWNFYGALSDVEYLVMVTDWVTETRVVYRNPPGDLCGQADVLGFPGPDLLSRSASAPRKVELEPRPDAGLTGCLPDDTTLCLTPDRFRVSVTWRDQRSGNTGVGRVLSGTSDSGYFWFFNQENVELVVKVLDGRTVNGFHWVFYGALTDVEYTITVTDTVTGDTKQYVNPPGNICGNADVTAF